MSFTLQPWEEAHLDSLVENGNNPNIGRTMMNRFPHPYTAEAGRDFIALAASHNPTRMFAIVANGQAVGGIGVHPQTDIDCKNAEIGYWLGEAHWGKGIATAAVRQMVDYGFRTFDILRIYGRVFETNPASARVLLKCGFEQEAHIRKCIFKNGQLLDEYIYGIRTGAAV